MTVELFIKIALAVVTLCSAVITGVVIPLLKQKMGAEKFDKLIYYATVAIRCAEQLYTPDQWKEKKEYVMEFCLNVARNNLHIEIERSDLDVIVEGIVNEIKYPNGKLPEVRMSKLESEEHAV